MAVQARAFVVCRHIGQSVRRLNLKNPKNVHPSVYLSEISADPTSNNLLTDRYYGANCVAAAAIESIEDRVDCYCVQRHGSRDDRRDIKH
jgi:hypothetical protein